MGKAGGQNLTDSPMPHLVAADLRQATSGLLFYEMGSLLVPYPREDCCELTEKIHVASISVHTPENSAIQHNWTITFLEATGDGREALARQRFTVFRSLGAPSSPCSKPEQECYKPWS